MVPVSYPNPPCGAVGAQRALLDVFLGHFDVVYTKKMTTPKVFVCPNVSQSLTCVCELGLCLGSGAMPGGKDLGFSREILAGKLLHVSFRTDHRQRGRV